MAMAELHTDDCGCLRFFEKVLNISCEDYIIGSVLFSLIIRNEGR